MTGTEAAPARTLRAQRLANVVVRALLRTPGLARLVGRRLVTLHVVGRKSGKRYDVPVAYLARGDQLVIGTPFAWARNLRTGEPIEIRLRGRLRRAEVTVDTDETAVVAAYADMARANPTFARFNGVALSDAGEPDPDDLHRAWRAGARVITLTPQPE